MMTFVQKLPTWLKVQLVLIIASALLYGSLYLLEYCIPILILMGATVLMTYLLLSPVDWLHEQIKTFPIFNSSKIPINPRGVSILIVYLLFFLLVFVVGIKTIPPLSDQIKSISENIPQYAKKAEDWAFSFKSVRQWYEKTEQEKAELSKNQSDLSAPSSAVTVSPDNPAKKHTPILSSSFFSSWLAQIQSKGMQFAVGLGSTTITTLVYSLTMFVMVFYLLMDGAILKKSLVELMPPTIQKHINEYLSEIHQVLNTFVKTQLILSLGVGICLYLALTILDVKYAFFLCIFYGIASIVPVIGPWVGAIPTLLIVSLSDHPVTLIPIFVSLSIFYVIKVYWLLPRLFKQSLEIHPVIMITTLLACIRLGHLPGIILAFPLASLICGTQQYLLEQKAKRFSAH